MRAGYYHSASEFRKSEVRKPWWPKATRNITVTVECDIHGRDCFPCVSSVCSVTYFGFRKSFTLL